MWEAGKVSLIERRWGGGSRYYLEVPGLACFLSSPGSPEAAVRWSHHHNGLNREQKVKKIHVCDCLLSIQVLKSPKKFKKFLQKSQKKSPCFGQFLLDSTQCVQQCRQQQQFPSKKRSAIRRHESDYSTAIIGDSMSSFLFKLQAST
jgi:hypothetical protein